MKPKGNMSSSDPSHKNAKVQKKVTFAMKPRKSNFARKSSFCRRQVQISSRKVLKPEHFKSKVLKIDMPRLSIPMQCSNSGGVSTCARMLPVQEVLRDGRKPEACSATSKNLSELTSMPSSICIPVSLEKKKKKKKKKHRAEDEGGRKKSKPITEETKKEGVDTLADVFIVSEQHMEEADYESRLQETISKITELPSSPRLEQSSTAAKTECISDPPPCSVNVDTLLITSSIGVQADLGHNMDNEVLDSYVEVKVQEVLYEMKDSLLRVEEEFLRISEEREGMDAIVEEKMKMLMDMPRPACEDKSVSTDCFSSQASKDMATQTKSSWSRRKKAPAPIHQSSSSPTRPEPDSESSDPNNVEYMFEHSASSARSRALRPQSWFVRHILREKFGPKTELSDMYGWKALGPELHGPLTKLSMLCEMLKLLPLDPALSEHAVSVADYLTQLLVYVPFCGCIGHTFNIQEICQSRTNSLSACLLAMKLKEVITAIRTVYWSSSSAILPSYFKSKLIQADRAAVKGLTFTVSKMPSSNVGDASATEPSTSESGSEYSVSDIQRFPPPKRAKNEDSKSVALIDAGEIAEIASALDKNEVTKIFKKMSVTQMLALSRLVQSEIVGLLEKSLSPPPFTSGAQPCHPRFQPLDVEAPLNDSIRVVNASANTLSKSVEVVSLGSTSTTKTPGNDTGHNSQQIIKTVFGSHRFGALDKPRNFSCATSMVSSASSRGVMVSLLPSKPSTPVTLSCASLPLLSSMSSVSALATSGTSQGAIKVSVLPSKLNTPQATPPRLASLVCSTRAAATPGTSHNVRLLSSNSMLSTSQASSLAISSQQNVQVPQVQLPLPGTSHNVSLPSLNLTPSTCQASSLAVSSQQTVQSPQIRLPLNDEVTPSTSTPLPKERSTQATPHSSQTPRKRPGIDQLLQKIVEKKLKSFHILKLPPDLPAGQLPVTTNIPVSQTPASTLSTSMPFSEVEAEPSTVLKSTSQDSIYVSSHASLSATSSASTAVNVSSSLQTPTDGYFLTKTHLVPSSSIDTNVTTKPQLVTCLGANEQVITKAHPSDINAPVMSSAHLAAPSSINTQVTNEAHLVTWSGISGQSKTKVQLITTMGISAQVSDRNESVAEISMSSPQSQDQVTVAEISMSPQQSQDQVTVAEISMSPQQSQDQVTAAEISMSHPQSQATPNSLAAAGTVVQCTTSTMLHPQYQASVVHTQGIVQSTSPLDPIKGLVHSMPVILNAARNDNNVVLQWTFPEDMHRSVSCYLLLYSDRATSPPLPTTWTPIGSVVPLPLPMAVTLSNITGKKCCMFTVKAVFQNGLQSKLSNPVLV